MTEKLEGGSLKITTLYALTLITFSWVSIIIKGNYSPHTHLIGYLEPLQQCHKLLLEVRLLK